MRIKNLSVGKKISLVYVISVLVLLITAAIFLIINNKSGINNYDKHLSSLPGDTRLSIDSSLYNIVKLNSNSDKVDISDAKIRDGSVKQNQNTDTKIYSGSLIVDLEKNKQSYQVTFRWVDSGDSIISGDTVNIKCIPIEELVYGDFNCKDSSSGYDEYIAQNPILNYLPHYTYNYEVTANTNGDKVTGLNVDIILYNADIRESSREAATNKYKLEFVNWLKSIGLKPDDYQVNYTVYP